MSGKTPLRVTPGRVEFRVRLTPKAGADAIGNVEADGRGGTRLRVRVTAPPEKGRANTALLRLLARAFGLAPSRLEVASGAKDRDKLVAIPVRDAAEAAEIGERIAASLRARESETMGEGV